MGDVPFKSVYITSLVRDEHGQKMSKSKGNVVDPLELIGEIGADAFRFTLASLASPGMDISLSEGRLRGYRQFINKVWNASRFVLINVPPTLNERPAVPPTTGLNLIHRWMLHRTSALADELHTRLTDFRFDVASDRLYHFFWHEYADWYIELVKPELQSRGEARDVAIAVLLEVHDRLLRMLHPFIPFVTEEIWQALPKRPGDGMAPNGQDHTITLTAFPRKEPEWVDDEAVSAMSLLKELTTTIRTVRSEWGVPPARRISVIVQGASPEIRQIIETQQSHVTGLAGLGTLDFATKVERNLDTVRRVVRDFQVHIPLAGIVDRNKETERIKREVAKLRKRRGVLQARLSNRAFIERAAPEVVLEATTQESKIGIKQKKLEQILEELGG